MLFRSNRAEKQGINLPDEVVDYIASHINTNVRELEGAFNSLVMIARIKEKPITLPFAMEALKDKIPLDGGNTLTVDIIIDKVCDRYGVTKEQVLSNARPKKYVVPRHSHILPYFDASGLKLQQVTRQLLQDYMDEKAAHGRKDGKGGLSPRSLRLHKNILYQALTEAVKAGLLSANPCEYIDLPSVPRHEAHFYTAEQVQTLLDSIRDDPLFPLVKITAIYGLRRSELLGLQWDSIDFESGTLTIRHTVSKVTKPVEKDKTKNASSYRSFPLLPEARAIFLQALSDQRTNRRLFGKAYQENPYVFKWPDGRPFPPDYITHHFARLLQKNGLPRIRFHELRHSCASILLSNGFTLKDVQEWRSEERRVGKECRSRWSPYH